MITETTTAPTVAVLALGLFEGWHTVADLPSILDAVEPDQGERARRRSAVLVSPRAPGERPETLARKVRGLARDCDIAVVDIEAPRVVVELVRRIAASLAVTVPADQLPELVRRLADATVTTAVLDDVSRLRTPTPSLTQHARSALPGACFVVTPERTVVSGHQVARAAWRDALAAVTPDRLAATSGGPAVAEFLPLLPPGTPVVEPAAPGGRDPYWGARGWLEVCWLTRPPEAVAAQVANTPASVCGNCGRHSHRERCDYCGAATRQAPGRKEAMTP